MPLRFRKEIQEMSRSRHRLTTIAFLAVSIAILFAVSLMVGAVSIPLADIAHILTGQGEVKETWRFIILENRLPQAVTALFAGAALAVSGLLLQTTFRNPLAGPDIFGISSGASLGVALVMLAMGGQVSVAAATLTGYAAILSAALAGALAVTAIIMFFSLRVKNPVMLLIVGIMTGFVVSSVVSLLNFAATEEGVRSYMLWGLGNFGGVSMRLLPVFVTSTALPLIIVLLMVKPLNALLIGDSYARNLGVDTRRMRRLVLFLTSVLTAVTTAFCGPIAFIGLAVPHVARLLFATSNHRLLLPATILLGSAVALLCNVICLLPGSRGIIPLNAVTPLLGAPVIIYIVARGTRM
jgi:iron complex transport system permease protein